MKAKLTKLFTLLAVLIFGISNVWGGDSFPKVDNFENGTCNYGKSNATSIATNSTKEHVRTGEKSVVLQLNTSSTGPYTKRSTKFSFVKNTYIHAIGWIKSDDYEEFWFKLASSDGTKVKFGGDANWHQISATYHYTSSTADKDVAIYITSDKKGNKVYYDDIVYYSSNSDVTDTSYPNGPTAGVSTTTAINWTNRDDSGDGATGRQATLIWKRQEGSANDLTLNNQGVYSLTDTEGPSTDQSGHWTLVTASVAADATSYEGTFVAGDVYAIVHCDLAYNYSEPAYVTITAGETYDATFADGGHGTAPAKAEGVSSVTLTEITGVAGWKNTGWKADVATKNGTTDVPANTLIANDETITLLENTTFTAQWADAYSVTFTFGEGSGTAPSGFESVEGAKFNLPGQGDMVAPSGKAFDGWKANGTGDKIAAGAEYTMTAAAVEFVAQWKAAPTVLFHWRYDGSTTTLNSELSATGGTVTLKSTDTNNYSAESASYNANVPDDMKSTGTKGLKTGKSAQYLEIECTVNFEEGDTIAVTAYGNKDGAGITGWKVSSSDGNTGDIATQTPAGNSNSDYQVGKVVIPSTFVAAKKFYLTRAAGTGTGIAAIKVIRPAARTIISTVVELTSASIGDDALSAADFATLTTGPAYTYALETKANEAPTMHFNKRTTITYDEGDPKVTNEDIAVAATDNGAGYWQAQSIVNAITYTIKVAKPATYAITYYPGANGSGSIAPGNKAEDVVFTLSSERFTRAGYLQTGWATADGGAKVYELGATYTENADLDLYPFWTELDTYVASFACGSTPAGWTYSNDGFDTDSKATVASVCTFVDNGLGTPKTTTGDGTEDDDVAFAKNPDAIATYDLGITTTVAALNVVLNGGSSSAFNETIEYLGADGSTVKQSYTNSLSAGNWNDNTISKTDVVADVRYIRVHGASKWVVMKSFSVSYIETRTKYDVAFAAGTGASGTMPTLHYVEDAEVVLPASTFTAPTDKEFDAWTSSDVTITDGKFTMPASDVTVTATWKDAITRYDVTFETNGGSTIDAQEVEENGHPTAVADPTKANYVFVGWFNNSDLAPEHAVADITALTITDDITLYAKWQLDIRLRQLVFSNGFDAFIKNNEVKAYYMEGTSAPTMVSYQGVNLKDVADAVTIVGNKVRMVGTDDSVIELDLILEAVTPMSSYDKQIFDGTETYVKTGNEFSTTSGKLGWKFSKNDGDWTRETPGQNRIYFFVGGSADRATFTSGASSRAIKVYVNNELVSSVETTAAAGSTFDVPLPAANTYNMIAIISNQTSGDGSVTDIQLNEHVISTDVSLSSLTVNGTAIDLQDGVYTYNFELPYGTVDAPTVVAVANAAPYATVSAITVDGTTKATFTVTAESSATQDYVVNFSIARFPTITLWDGSTMNAVVENGDASLNGITWASAGVNVTSFSAKTCADNGKSYTKALDFGGNTKATRQFSITIPDGNVARISLVCNAKGTSARSISVGTDLAGVIDENAVSSIETADNTNLFAVAFDFFAAGTLFINTTDGFQVHEITIQMAPGYGRSAMLGNGVLGTVCVPNNVVVEDIQGATFFELMGREPEHGKLAFDEITSGELEAGVPYLFQAQGNHIALLYGATHVANPVYKDNGMYGTFSTIVLTELEDIYYFAQKALWSCKGAVDLTIAANRAYVKLSKVNELSSASPAPGRRRILLGVNGENQATGFENIEHGDAPMKVMIEGTLYIFRGEKVFDATGRLVK